MPNLATILKEEIRRLARKEIKAETSQTKTATARFRREIAALKRQLQAQQKKIAALESQRGKQSGKPSLDEPTDNIRFSSKSVKAQRRRTGLSAADYGKLVGVSPLTVYHWEQGKSKPRQQQLARLVEIRGIGKKEAVRRLGNGRA